MLAPFRVEFYDKEWTRLGIKLDLAKVIIKATGIDREALAGKAMKTFGWEE